MATAVQHNPRPSIDRVFDLLADLDDNQVNLLLEDFNNTVSSNVPVSQGIDFFDPDAPTRPRKSWLPRRQPSKQVKAQRISSAPAAPTPVETPVRPKMATHPAPKANSQSSRPRGYKRISRPPMLPAPLASPDLRELLAAYLCETPLDLSSTCTTPSMSPANSRSASTLSMPDEEDEDEAHFLDLLEPSAARSLHPAGGHEIGGMTPWKEPTGNISGIFEVLDI